jgi:type IX secretion system PorP/SprF family membrane protein
MSKLFRVLILTLVCTSGFRSLAQNYPVYNSYYINNYLYNPAEALTDYTYVYVNHRRQWLGVEGAPVLYTINVNTSFKNSRAGVGGKISSFQRGLLNTTDLSLTYAYGFPVNQKNSLFFGLSGGAIMNTIDTDKISDPNDPAIAGYLSNNFQPTANFGFLYRSAKGVNFSVALPQLFAPAYNAGSNFSGSPFSPLDNMIISLYYKRIVDGKLVVRKKKGIRAKVKSNEAAAPLEFYLMYKYSKDGTSQAEALVKLNLSEHFWLGGAYRQAYGFAGIMGISYNKFILSYAYELGGQPEPGFSSGTHELQLGLRLGKQKKFIKPTPTFRSTLKTGDEQHIARFQQTVEDTEQVEDEEQDEKKKYYVVIKVFTDFNGADAFKKKLLDEKYNANIFYNEKDKKYYVHVLETTKASEAHEEAKNLKQFTKLKDARVLTIVAPK